MGKVVIWSDLHSHNYARYSKTLKNGVNSRLQDCLNVIQEVREFCVKNEVKNSIFLGDLFHARFKIDVEVFNAVYSELAKFKDAGITLWLLAGNHDFAILRRKVSSIGTFEEIAEVILEPCTEVIDGMQFCFVPYCEDAGKFKDAVKGCATQVIAGHYLNTQLLCHQGISEGFVRAGVRVKEQVSEKDLRHKYFKGVLLGHYHMAQTLAPNIMYVGATLQHNWGDTGQKRGFIFMQQEEGEELTLTRIETHAPKFVTLQVGWAITKEEVNGNFIKLASKVPMDALKIEKMRKVIKELDASSVEFDVPVKTQVKKRIDVGLDMSFEQMVEKYVESGVVETKDFDKDKLIKVGKGIVEASHG